MKIKNAQVSDIEEIMKIEEACFAHGIRERKEVFLERIKAFSDGFILLESESSVEGNLKNSEKSLYGGYCCSEIWRKKDLENTGIGEELFLLNHDINKRHASNGEVLYISSLAIVKDLQGNGAGRFLFQKTIEKVCCKYPTVTDLILLVCEDWKGARHIYESEGFTDVKRLSGFFCSSVDGQTKKSDGIVMIKKL